MLIIFDCDGVLIDSESIYSAVDSAALMRLGHCMSPIEMARRFSGLCSEEIWPVLAGEFGFIQPEGFLDQIRVEYEKLCETELQAIHGVVDTIEAIMRLGDLVCVASCTPRPRLELNLKRTGPFNAFAPHIYSVSQVSRTKPAPDVLLYAASQMGADPHECIVIEDSVTGITAARRAGMTAYGFIGGAYADEGIIHRLTAAGAKQVFESMEHLRSYLCHTSRSDRGKWP